MCSKTSTDIQGDSGAGSNEGGGGESRNLYLLSHEDFCVYGPKEANTPIASSGQDVISWCTKVSTGPDT
jgi:hypothetical protein